eukprot:1186857-Pyramimonas_sp.AAC.1
MAVRKRRLGWRRTTSLRKPPLRVLEAIVQPADVKRLSAVEYPLLRTAMAGSEIGLGCPRTMDDL